jgi:two-component sensor histidine kinase
MTAVGSARSDHASRSFEIRDRLRRALTVLAVQAWRSSDVRLRDELSRLAERIRAVIDHYEQRRNVGVLSVVAADYLERLRRRLAAAAGCELRWIRLVVGSGALSNDGAFIIGLITSELVAAALAQAGVNSSRLVTVRFGRDLSGHLLTVSEPRQLWREAIPSAPDSVGMAFVRQLVRDVEGSFATVNGGAGVSVRLPFGDSRLALPLRNISPPRTPEWAPAHALAKGEAQ